MKTRLAVVALAFLASALVIVLVLFFIESGYKSASRKVITDICTNYEQFDKLRALNAIEHLERSGKGIFIFRSERDLQAASLVRRFISTLDLRQANIDRAKEKLLEVDDSVERLSRRARLAAAETALAFDRKEFAEKMRMVLETSR